MTLPVTRNTTYAANTEVKSADLNALQDECVVAADPTSAQYGIDDVTKDTTEGFIFIQHSKYHRGGGFLIESNSIHVPRTGIYLITINATIDRLTSAGQQVKTRVRLVDGGGFGPVVGRAIGYRYDSTESMPARVTASFLVEIDDPPIQKLRWEADMDDLTPETETELCDHHQFVIQRVGSL